MEAKASAKFLRVPPRKARRVVDAIRGQRVDRALTMLAFTPVAAAKAIHKLVRSAAANAENNHGMDRSALVISRAFVDRGPSIRRLEARARGQAAIKRKRMSHVTIVVSDGEDA